MPGKDKEPKNLNNKDNFLDRLTRENGVYFKKISDMREEETQKKDGDINQPNESIFRDGTKDTCRFFDMKCDQNFIAANGSDLKENASIDDIPGYEKFNEKNKIKVKKSGVQAMANAFIELLTELYSDREDDYSINITADEDAILYYNFSQDENNNLILTVKQTNANITILNNETFDTEKYHLPFNASISFTVNDDYSLTYINGSKYISNRAVEDLLNAEKGAKLTYLKEKINEAQRLEAFSAFSDNLKGIIKKVTNIENEQDQEIAEATQQALQELILTYFKSDKPEFNFTQLDTSSHFERSASGDLIVDINIDSLSNEEGETLIPHANCCIRFDKDNRENIQVNFDIKNAALRDILNAKDYEKEFNTVSGSFYELKIEEAQNLQTIYNCFSDKKGVKPYKELPNDKGKAPIDEDQDKETIDYWQKIIDDADVHAIVNNILTTTFNLEDLYIANENTIFYNLYDTIIKNLDNIDSTDDFKHNVKKYHEAQNKFWDCDLTYRNSSESTDSNTHQRKKYEKLKLKQDYDKSIKKLMYEDSDAEAQLVGKLFAFDSAVYRYIKAKNYFLKSIEKDGKYQLNKCIEKLSPDSELRQFCERLLQYFKNEQTDFFNSIFNDQPSQKISTLCLKIAQWIDNNPNEKNHLKLMQSIKEDINLNKYKDLETVFDQILNKEVEEITEQLQSELMRSAIEIVLENADDTLNKLKTLNEYITTFLDKKDIKTLYSNINDLNDEDVLTRANKLILSDRILEDNETDLMFELNSIKFDALIRKIENDYPLLKDNAKEKRSAIKKDDDDALKQLKGLNAYVSAFLNDSDINKLYLDIKKLEGNDSFSLVGLNKCILSDKILNDKKALIFKLSYTKCHAIIQELHEDHPNLSDIAEAKLGNIKADADDAIQQVTDLISKLDAIKNGNTKALFDKISGLTIDNNENEEIKTAILNYAYALILNDPNQITASKTDFDEKISSLESLEIKSGDKVQIVKQPKNYINYLLAQLNLQLAINQHDNKPDDQDNQDDESNIFQAGTDTLNATCNLYKENLQEIQKNDTTYLIEKDPIVSKATITHLNATANSLNAYSTYQKNKVLNFDNGLKLKSLEKSLNKVTQIKSKWPEGIKAAGNTILSVLSGTLAVGCFFGMAATIMTGGPVALPLAFFIAGAFAAVFAGTKASDVKSNITQFNLHNKQKSDVKTLKNASGIILNVSYESI